MNFQVKPRYGSSKVSLETEIRRSESQLPCHSAMILKRTLIIVPLICCFLTMSIGAIPHRNVVVSAPVRANVRNVIDNEIANLSRTFNINSTAVVVICGTIGVLVVLFVCCCAQRKYL